MSRILYHATVALLLSAMLGWVVVSEINRTARLAELTNARQQVEREMDRIRATKQAQKYAEPIIALSEQLAAENAMFSTIVEKARALVTARTDELNRTKEALNHSVGLLRDQIEENNRCADHIRSQEKFIRELLKKIPEADRPEPPKFEEPKSDGKLPAFLWE
jgi:HAMP domain-containing protein